MIVFFLLYFISVLFLLYPIFKFLEVQEDLLDFLYLFLSSCILAFSFLLFYFQFQNYYFSFFSLFFLNLFHYFFFRRIQKELGSYQFFCLPAFLLQFFLFCYICFLFFQSF